MVKYDIYISICSCNTRENSKWRPPCLLVNRQLIKIFLRKVSFYSHPPRLSPTTSLSSFNKRDKESAHAGDLQSDTPKACVSGHLMKRGLVKQTLRYNQHTPSSSRNCQESIGIGQRESITAYQPCKSSNIEPQTVTTPFLRVPVNHIRVTSRQQQEMGLNMNANLATCDSVTRGNLTKPVSVAARDCRVRRTTPCTTP